VELGQTFLDPLFWVPSPRPQLHERRIYHDPVKPGRETASALELRQRAEGQEERLLHDITGILFI
jgi:hypothetical protein